MLSLRLNISDLRDGDNTSVECRNWQSPAKYRMITTVRHQAILYNRHTHRLQRACERAGSDIFMKVTNCLTSPDLLAPHLTTKLPGGKLTRDGRCFQINVPDSADGSIHADFALSQLALHGVDVARFVPRVYDKVLGGWVDLTPGMFFSLSEVSAPPALSKAASRPPHRAPRAPRSTTRRTASTSSCASRPRPPWTRWSQPRTTASSSSASWAPRRRPTSAPSGAPPTRPRPAPRGRASARARDAGRGRA